MQKIHLKAPKNWINDPNGFIYFKGKYHLFYQHFPYAPLWGRMHWGHAVSDDLVTWEHKDIALYPSKKDDRSGCFSGSAVEYKGKMHVFYTGINYITEDSENINRSVNDDFIASQMSITSNDGFCFDNLLDKKTVIPAIQDELIGSCSDTRDPKVWRGRNAWYMILGSRAENKGRFLLYKSDDLESWHYANYCTKENLGRIWECPDYFEVDGMGMVFFSPIGILKNHKMYNAAAVWMKANFSEESCSLELGDKYEFIDYGLDLYAPQTALDKEGRRVMIAWMRMPQAVSTENGEWNGMMCLPRVIHAQNGHVYFRPHPNIRNAFKHETKSPSCKKGYMLKTTLNNGESINLGGYIIKRENDRIFTDRTNTYAENVAYEAFSETPRISNGNLEIYVDANLIEVYVNDGEYVLSNIVYNLTDDICGHKYTAYSLE